MPRLKKPAPALPAVERHLRVQGLALHVRTAGTRHRLPDIVLEAGNGSLLERARLLEEALTPFARVLSYERAGIGASEGSGATCAQVAERLRAILRSPEHHPKMKLPVILVGHSLGGLYARYYASTHPQDVAGLVLIDPTPEDLAPSPWQARISTVLLWGIHCIARTRIPEWWLGRRPPPDGGPNIAVAGARAYARAHHVRSLLEASGTRAQTQQDVAARNLPPGLPVLCVTAGSRPRGAQKYVAPIEENHARIAATGHPGLSRHVRMASATHMGLVGDPAQVRALAELILEFSRDVARHRGPVPRARPAP